MQGLKYNILSVSHLNNLGHKLVFDKKKVKIFDDEGNLIGIGIQTKGNLFYLYPIVGTCLFARVGDVWLWYKRLCHVNF